MDDVTFQPQAATPTPADAATDASAQRAPAEIATPEQAIAYTDATQGGSVAGDPAHVASAKLQTASDTATAQAQRDGGDVAGTQAAFESAASQLGVQYPTRFVQDTGTDGPTVVNGAWAREPGRTGPTITPVDFDATQVDADVDAALQGLKDPSGSTNPLSVTQKNLGTVAETAKTVADAASRADDPQAANRLIQEQFPKIQAAATANYNASATFENRELLAQYARLGSIAKNGGDEQTFQQILAEAKRNPAAITADPLDPEASLEGLPLLIELDKNPGTSGVLDTALSQINADTRQLATDYAQHTQGLNWAISNLGQGASPAELQKAIDGYVNAQGAEWKQTYTSLQQQLAARGEQLLTATQQLRTQLPDGEARTAVESLLASKEGQLAVETALIQKPELSADATVVQARNWLAGGGEGAKAVAGSLGNAYVQHALGQAGSAGEIQAKLAELSREPGLAESLGLSQKDFDAATTEIGKATLAGDVSLKTLEGLAGGNAAKLASLGKLAGNVGGALSALGLANDVKRGDVLGGILNGGALAGSFFGGPAGWTAATVLTAARLGLDQYRAVQQANQTETPAGQAFLRGLGYSEKAAEQLINNTGSGQSAVSLLQRYTGELGLSREDSIRFINHLAANDRFKASGGPGATEGNALRYLVEDKLHAVLDAGTPDSINGRSASNRARDFIRGQIDAWNRAGRP